MWTAQTESLEEENIVRYKIFYQNSPLTFGDMIRRWQEEKAFGRFFSQALAKASWPAYFWEMPPLYEYSLTHTAEFVLVRSHQLARVSPDNSAFRAYFVDQNISVVNFRNLGGDAQLIAPLPWAEPEVYTHLATFVRGAPEDQQVSLWQHLGHLLAKNMGKHPLWVSTSGLGVHWLHLRLDTSPKYYQFLPYRSP